MGESTRPNEQKPKCLLSLCLIIVLEYKRWFLLSTLPVVVDDQQCVLSYKLSNWLMCGALNALCRQ